MPIQLLKNTTIKKYHFSFLLLLFLFLSGSRLTFAQCPPNIDFEAGTFNNWQCWWGSFNNMGVINVNPTIPVTGRHDMLADPPGNGLDYYGEFPKNCPNGSGHSIKIGNETTGQTADAVSYQFTIPVGQNTFNLIYHYALVLNDANNGSHPPLLQPRLIVSVENITDNTPLPCPLPPIVVGSGLPGFFDSRFTAPNGSAVRCKDWAAASMKLDNLAGKTIRITYTVTGCGLTNGSHFGYAYIDMNSECSSSFVGATYCPDDNFINVTAPSGYQNYAWWNITDPATILATTQTINFTPPPPAGTTLQVALTPYAGYGCNDTLTAVLLDTLTVFANAGPDRLSCQNAPVQLGINPRQGFVYSWSPVTGLSNPNISNPIATPSVTTQYILTVTNAGGGCLTRDTMIVNAAVINNTITLTGPGTICSAGPETAVLEVVLHDSIQWYLNGVAIPGANQTQYNVLQTGAYYATLFSFTGCNLSTATQNITVYDSPVAGFTSSAASQCFNGNQFIFTNTSTIASGTMQYNWDLGDGNTATTANVTHSYAIEGTYTVKLLVTSDNGCIDSTSFNVIVYPSAIAGFTVDLPTQCAETNLFTFTNTSTVSSGNISYRWDMGDGTILTTANVVHSYATWGNYTVQLIATADQGCADTTSFNVSAFPKPVAGFTINAPVQCYGNHQFIFTNTSTISAGLMSYNWDLGDGNTANTTDVTHQYAQPGDYIVTLVVTSQNGCADTLFYQAKVHPYPFAGFVLQEPGCTNLPLLIINTTNNNTLSTLIYDWDFGNGQSSTMRNPVYAYPAPGNFTITLSVSTAQCPQTVTTHQLPVNIDAPLAGIRYPDKEAIFNFPEKLQARQIGNTVLWTPATSLDDRHSYTPYFKGLLPQLYTIEMKTASGCITVDTQYVRTKKKIEIYVPTIFTPGNSDGLNDYLRPNLMGIVKVNSFRVYNRWGKLLYQMQSDRPGWDGRINGQLQEMQTVVWMIEAIDVDGNLHKRKGTTVLMR
ncbi:MAG: PKD domain-containing protein [Chitinophagaceae bacterium]|nr:PKD domain-containing protein [Chitinophagaceae bacterium]